MPQVQREWYGQLEHLSNNRSSDHLQRSIISCNESGFICLLYMCMFKICNVPTVSSPVPICQTGTQRPTSTFSTKVQSRCHTEIQRSDWHIVIYRVSQSSNVTCQSFKSKTHFQLRWNCMGCSYHPNGKGEFVNAYSMLTMDCILSPKTCLIVHLMCMSTSRIGCFQLVLGIAIVPLRVKGMWMFAPRIMM